LIAELPPAAGDEARGYRNEAPSGSARQAGLTKALSAF
jgi:hypothetical protein